MPITKSEIERMSAGSVLWDTGRGALTGFGVRKQRRDPIFVLKLTQNGRQKWITIGRFGAPWTIEQARSEARVLVGRISAGEPILPSKAEVPEICKTVGQICDEYLESARAGSVLTRFNRPKKATTLSIDVGRIERHIKPLIGEVPIDELDARKVRQVIEDITLGKTAAEVKTSVRGVARVTGGKGTAARVADLLSGIMTWSVDQGYVHHNPVHGVRRFRGEPRQRFLTEEELHRLGTVLSAGEDADARSFHPFAISILRILCLTGCRSGEVAQLKWAELDSSRKCIRLTDTKTGFSLRPLGDAALEHLLAIDKQSSPYVFPASSGDGPYQGLKKQAKRIFLAAGLEDVTGHVLRHTFASVASELGYSDATIAGLLGHKGRGVTSRYVHRPDAAIAGAAQAVSSAIASYMSTPLP